MGFWLKSFCIPAPCLVTLGYGNLLLLAVKDTQ